MNLTAEKLPGPGNVLPLRSPKTTIPLLDGLSEIACDVNITRFGGAGVLASRLFPSLPKNEVKPTKTV